MPINPPAEVTKADEVQVAVQMAAYQHRYLLAQLLGFVAVVAGAVLCGPLGAVPAAAGLLAGYAIRNAK